jgi:ubiquinone/menaquinone biosynthesis C-methylase UbiE
MKAPVVDMTTDSAWEEWGRLDPYFGVITEPQFRRSNINENSRQEFFDSGGSHVNYVLTTVRKHIDAAFSPRTILDFGCGVGRLLVHFATVANDVLGLDVSPSMLLESRKNCDERGLRNVRLLPSDDALSTLSESFDLVHSSIVLQHIPVERGRRIFAKLLRHVRPGGVGSIQLTYSKSIFSATNGVAPPASPVAARGGDKGNSDPEIQMNPYNINEILWLMQHRGVTRFYTEFTDHGGELGLFLFFQAPPASLPGLSASTQSK